MVNTLEGQTVVILGGSSGFGYATAEYLLESTKAKVWIASSNPKKIARVVSSLDRIGGKDRIAG
jgi:NAD(P)-dependent dehydrogenase (short-subunit alcohol dehydrogenase family)